LSSHYDQHLTCADCGHDFVWTAKDQEFFREKGYQQPKRCKECRQAKKERREDYDRRGGGNR
jgi:DNA replicative helicase MCM subunit Mcm2 (Cdc46/Mcm family)